MKRILSIAVASLAVAAVADSFSPQIGVTTLSLSNKNSVIPVQFESLVAGTTGGKVTADALVCTNNIPLNSHLYIYQNGAYTAWTLEASGWAARDVTSTSDDGVVHPGVPAAGQVLDVGTGIWLSLNGATSATVSFYGKVASQTNSTISAGTSEAPVSTLVCNPTAGAVSLAGKIGTGKVVPVKGDKITLLGGSTYSGYYSYNGNVWKHIGETITTETPTIPAYGGFWYLSKGGAGTINWVE